MKHIALSLIFALALCTQVLASTKAQQVEFLLSQVRTTAGPLAGGKVYFYSAGTTTPKTVWLDRDKTTVAANPYTLDANGTAQLYAEGLYKVVIKNSAGVSVYSRDNLAFIAFSATETSNSQTVGGYFPDTGTTGSTVPVRDGNGKLPGDILGNAATVTNGVYTTGDQTIAGVKTFSSPIAGSITGNAATATEATHAATATTATTSTNATAVGGFTPSQTPVASQIPVLDSSKMLTLPGSTGTYPIQYTVSGGGNTAGSTIDMLGVSIGGQSANRAYVRWTRGSNQGRKFSLITADESDNQNIGLIQDFDGKLYHGTTSNAVWSADNDGAGSGLDADTLDGINSTDFLRASQQAAGTKWVEVAAGSSTQNPATYGVALYTPPTTGHHLYMISVYVSAGKASVGYMSSTSEVLVAVYPSTMTSDRCGVIADWHNGGGSRTLYYKIWEWK